MVSTLVLIYFGRPPLGHKININCIIFQPVDPEICSILFFKKGSGTSLPIFCIKIFQEKHFPSYIL